MFTKIAEFMYWVFCLIPTNLLLIVCGILAILFILGGESPFLAVVLPLTWLGIMGLFWVIGFILHDPLEIVVLIAVGVAFILLRR